MSGELVRIRPDIEITRQLTAVPDIVAALEDVLEKAKAGEVRAIGLTTIQQLEGEFDCSVGTYWHRGEGASIFTLLGGCSHLHRRIQDGIE